MSLQSPALQVVVRADPPSMDRATLDRLMDGEISKFEEDFQRRQRAQGLAGEPLTSIERGVLKAFLVYGVTK